MLSVIFLVAAAICFGLAALKVPASIDWTNAGFCFVVLSMLPI